MDKDELDRLNSDVRTAKKARDDASKDLKKLIDQGEQDHQKLIAAAKHAGTTACQYDVLLEKQKVAKALRTLGKQPGLAAVAVDPGLNPQNAGNVNLCVIGFIIPGLIALWIDRQGPTETLAALVTSATVVRLVLIVLGLEVVA